MKKLLKCTCLLLILTLSLCTVAFAADDDNPITRARRHPAPSQITVESIHK